MKEKYCTDKYRTNFYGSKYFKVLIALFLFFLVLPLSAQNHYINASASGSNDGSNWTDAWTDIPSSFFRGHTYYIADGNYGSPRFNTAISGDSYITIVKATPENHGTDTGWNNSYGDGQASFEPTVRIETGYWIIEGSTGLADQESTYGFIVKREDGSGISRSELISFGTSTVSHVTISHVAVINCGKNFDIPQYNIYSNSYKSPSTDILIINNYFFNGSSNMLIRGWHDSTIEYNYFGYNWSSSNNHGQNISPGSDCDDIILRGNIFKDSSIFVVGTHKYDNHRWEVYNNIILGGNLTAAFANADSSSTDVVMSWYVHNNTFINVEFGGRGAVFVGTLSDPSNDKSYAYNNLYYNCTSPQYDVPNVDYSYSAFFSCDGTFDSSEGNTAQVESINPFVDLSVKNYSLESATEPGLVLTSPFNSDYLSVTRGEDGNWDRGAYEFNDSQSSGSDSSNLSGITIIVE